MYSNRISLTKKSFEQAFNFLQTYTYTRCIYEPNGSCYLSNFIIEQPDIFNIRQVESEQGNYSVRDNLNDLDGYNQHNQLKQSDGQNFTDEQDNIELIEKQQESMRIQNRIQSRNTKVDNLDNGRDTQDSLKQTAYFSQQDSQYQFENINDGNVLREHNKIEQNQSLKSKLLMKLIKEKTKKKSQLGGGMNSKMEQKMEQDISYLKKLRKHCNLR